MFNLLLLLLVNNFVLLSFDVAWNSSISGTKLLIYFERNKKIYINSNNFGRKLTKKEEKFERTSKIFYNYNNY